MAHSPVPYTISVPEARIRQVKEQLELASFPDELDDAGWAYGAPLADIKRLTEAWKRHDWRSCEARLNESLPQFKTDIEVDGFGQIGVHFVHQISRNSQAIPLLFVHGCRQLKFILVPLLFPAAPTLLECKFI